MSQVHAIISTTPSTYCFQDVILGFSDVTDLKKFLNNNNSFAHDKMTSTNLQDCKSIQDILMGFKNSFHAREFFMTNKICRFLSEEKIDQFCWTLDLIRKLEQFVDVPKFMRFLIKHEASITGSFILQIISGNFYEDSDIDIYVKNITQEVMNDFRLVTNDEGYLLTQKYVHENNVYNKIVSKLAEFRCKGKKFQLIEPSTEYNTISDYVNTFDLDICQNYFDGSKFYIKNLSNIKQKKAIYDATYFKYRSSDKDNDKRSDKVFIKFVERVCKYSARGYDIQFSINFIQNLMEEENNLIITKGSYQKKLLALLSDDHVVSNTSENKFEFVMKCIKNKFVFES